MPHAVTSCEPPGPPPHPGTAGPFPSPVGCLALHPVTLRVGRTCASTSLCSGTLLRSTGGGHKGPCGCSS